MNEQIIQDLVKLALDFQRLYTLRGFIAVSSSGVHLTTDCLFFVCKLLKRDDYQVVNVGSKVYPFEVKLEIDGVTFFCNDTQAALVDEGFEVTSRVNGGAA